jgi:prevent-host-death family protein
MPIIKPISDLRNKANILSELVHNNDEPIFITKNGEGDMVLMSLAHYAKIERRLALKSSPWRKLKWPLESGDVPSAVS